jgi:uncharacterized protein involved in exopolysaccharide biosynthesis
VEENNQKIDQDIFYKAEEDIVTFSKIYDVLIDNYKALIFSGFLGFIVSVPYSLLITPMYTAENIMLIPSSQTSNLSSLSSQLGGFASFAGVNIGGSDTSRAETIAVFNSRVFAEKTINDLNLLPYFYEESWDSAKNAWKNGKPPVHNALELMQGIGFLSEDKRRSLFIYTIVWDDPVLAAQWSNQVIAIFNNYMREKAIIEAQKSIDYLKTELTNTNIVSLQNVLYQLIEQETQTAMLASVREDYAFKIIDPAITPDQRSSPNRTQLVILASGATFILGLFIILLLNLYRNKEAE